MKFYEELERLRAKKKSCYDEIEDNERKRKIEIKETIKQIDEKYINLISSKYDELKTYNDNIDSFNYFLANCSYFNVTYIGNIIASLISIFEGKNYIFQDTHYENFPEETENGLRIIVAEEDRSNTYLEHQVKSLVKKGKAIVLSEGDTAEDIMPFYKANAGNHSLDFIVKLGRFAYVKEFIDEVISYIIDNHLNDISFNELQKLEIEFLNARVSQINEYYQKRDAEQEEQLKQKLAKDREERQARLKRILSKKENS